MPRVLAGAVSVALASFVSSHGCVDCPALEFLLVLMGLFFDF